MLAQFQKITREVLHHTPLRRYFFPKYLYNFTPPQLCFLCNCLERTRDVPGSLAEVGCANGLTTIFLNKYMTCQNIEKPYVALDTFAGFVSEDIQYEVANRGKKERLFKRFQVNKKKWYDRTLRSNDVHRVRSIEADANRFDMRTLGPLSFVLLDVDLYRPMKKCMPELYEVLSPGGIMIIDDCDAQHIRWDGSDQAYKEFMKDIGQPARIVHGKLGVIEKPA